ncbi:hypothetical protein ACJIZ3_022959 [Penstemon smallii]|uniref:C2 domain-containing protein n=1 Tax=Penstemon smallii TaxID=265156 RepID=A0ABD3TQM6_9LAMI
MDPTIPTPTVCSTVTSSSISSQAPPPTPLQILEVSLISAQDLTPACKSMRTYAVTWIHPNRKLTTRIDQQNHTNPTWNEKFTFRLDNELLLSEDATLTVEIYTISWFRDVLVGTVCVLIGDLITPLTRNTHNQPKNTRFMALQVRRPSGTPQGILTMGVALLQKSMRSMSVHHYAHENFHDVIEKKVSSLHLKNKNQEDEKKEETKIQLWRSLSMGSEVNNGSVINGSLVNGSELCSDIGPSASIVAADLAKKLQPPPTARPLNQKKLYENVQGEDTGSSILEDLTIEEAKAKGYRNSTTRNRWRKEMSMKQNDFEDCDQSELSNISRHSRRNSDGGLFSCFGNAMGIEFTIVCGASSNARSSNNKSRRKNKPSEANST